MVSCGIPSISHLSFVFSVYTHSPKGLENTSDLWYIPWYSTQNHCITSIIISICQYKHYIKFWIRRSKTNDDDDDDDK